MALKGNPEYDAETQASMLANDEGFHAPEVPHHSLVLTSMKLACQQRTEWNEPPELGVLLSSFESHLGFYPLPIPKPSWGAYPNPAALLARLVKVLWEQERTDHALLRGVDRSMLVDMVGTYMLYEAWAPALSKEKAALQAVRQGLQPDLQRQADRREVRCVMGATVDGTFLVTSHYRDAPEKFSSLALDRHGNSVGNHLPVHEMKGNIPRMLLELAYGLVRHMRPAYANTPGRGTT